MEKQKNPSMQILQEDVTPTPLQKLNLMDDFLFDAATEDMEACKIIIELSLGIKIHRIAWKEGQKVMHNLPGRRGIRMDFYVEDDKGRLFDVEMQKRKEGNIPKRTRFYQAIVDAPLLKSGERGFDRLGPLYIVVICGFDLYGQKKYRYTFENLCREIPGLALGDECTKLLLNTKGKNDSEVPQSLIDFLHYVEKSNDDGIPEDCDKRLKYLHEVVKKIKSNEQMEVTYMKMEERDRIIRESGEIKGREMKLIEQVCKKLKKGKSPEVIAEELEEEMDEIQMICKAAEEAPDYDINEIWKRVLMEYCE